MLFCYISFLNIATGKRGVGKMNCSQMVAVEIRFSD